MKLWLLWQDERDGYDTYDSLVVAAETEEEARQIHPSRLGWEEEKADYMASYPWASKPENVKVKLLGEATPGFLPGIILASFNAG